MFTSKLSPVISRVFLALLLGFVLVAFFAARPEPPLPSSELEGLVPRGLHLRDLSMERDLLFDPLLLARAGTLIDRPQASLELPPGFTSSSAGGRIIFAHIGDGILQGTNQFMQTEFMLLNDSTYDSVGTLAFYDDSGNPLEIQVGSKKGASFPVTIKAGRMVRVTTAGEGAVKSGWALFESNQPAVGTASFSIRNAGGGVFADVGVGEAILQKEFTFFADSMGPANTGIAVANASATEQARLTFDLVSTGGQVRTSQSRDLPPLGHQAFFITELFKGHAGINEFEGTVRVSSEQPFGGTTLRSVGSLLTSVPMVAPADPLDLRQQLIFPQIADGSAAGLKITATVILFNNRDEAVSGTVDFFNSNGTPMTVKIGGQSHSSFSFNLPPRGFRRLATSGSGPIKVGWGQVTMDRAIDASAIFHISNDRGQLLSEVGVSPPAVTTQFSLVADSLANFRTGFALVNSTEDDEETTIRLFTGGGRLVGTKEVELAAKNHTSVFIDELFDDVPGIKEFEGFASVIGPVSGMALRQVGTLTTSLPSLGPVRGFAPVSLLEFPQHLISTRPPVRWRIDQGSLDLALDSLRIEAPGLTPQLGGFEPGDVLGYGYYLIKRPPLSQGGLVRMICTGTGSLEYDVVLSGPQVTPGTTLVSGRISSGQGGRLVLELGPTGSPNADWNGGWGLELDLTLAPGLIRTPTSARSVTISTTSTSASARRNEDGVSIVYSTKQKEAFGAAPGGGKPYLSANQPVFISSGSRLLLFGSGWGDSPQISFRSTDGGTTTSFFSEVVDGSLEVTVPPNAAAGALTVQNASGTSNELMLRSLFSPLLELTRTAGNSFSIALSLSQPPNQLVYRELQGTLSGATWTAGGLSAGLQVGTLTERGGSVLGQTIEEPIVIESISSGEIQLSADDWTATLVKRNDGGDSSILLTITRSGGGEIPAVNGNPWSLDFELPGVSFQGSGTPVWAADSLSGPADFFGNETGVTWRHFLESLE